jgi:Tol biopolymer transport system component
MNIRLRRILPWLSVAAVVAGCGGDAEPLASDDMPADLAARILFTSDRDGNDEIYSIDVQGGSVERLTDHPSHDVEPAWAPNRERIAFRSDRDGDWELYVMDADGGNVERVTHTTGRDIAPSWAPAGDRIAFVS